MVKNKSETRKMLLELYKIQEDRGNSDSCKGLLNCIWCPIYFRLSKARKTRVKGVQDHKEMHVDYLDPKRIR